MKLQIICLLNQNLKIDYDDVIKNKKLTITSLTGMPRLAQFILSVYLKRVKF